MEIRLVETNEFEETIALSNQTFRTKEQISMGVAFPQVFSKELSQSFAAFDKEQLISFVGLVPSIIHVGPAKLNVFSIGSVCTHIDYRNQGISSAILDKVLEHAEQADTSLLLVSGDRGLYRRVHCYPFGSVNKYLIDCNTANVNQWLLQYSGTVRESLPADIFHIVNLANAKSVKYETSLSDMYQLLKSEGYASIFNMRHKVFVAEKQGKVDAFVVFGIQAGGSSKLKSLVIETGGDSEAILAIIAEVLQKESISQVEFSVPFHEPLQSFLHGTSFTKRKNGGTIHIVNPNRLIQQLQPYFREKNQKVEMQSNEDESIHLIVNQQRFSINHEEFVELFFTGKEKGMEPIPLPFTEGLHYV